MKAKIFLESLFKELSPVENLLVDVKLLKCFFDWQMGRRIHCFLLYSQKSIKKQPSKE